MSYLRDDYPVARALQDTWTGQDSGSATVEGARRRAPGRLEIADLCPAGSALRRELIACLARMFRETHATAPAPEQAAPRPHVVASDRYSHLGLPEGAMHAVPEPTRVGTL